MTKDIRLEIKPRNNRVLTRMEELMIPNVAELCRLMGNANQSTVGNLVNLKTSPLLKSVTTRRSWRSKESDVSIWRPIAIRMAATLLTTPEDLFPEDLREAMVHPNTRLYAEVSMADMKRLGGGKIPKALISYTDPEVLLREKDDREILNKTLQTLTVKEEKVIRLRFGLDGEHEHTLAEVGDILKVRGERVRQIESKALRKLRGPRQRGHLRETCWYPVQK